MHLEHPRRPRCHPPPTLPSRCPAYRHNTLQPPLRRSIPLHQRIKEAPHHCLMDLLGAPTRSNKDVLKALFALALYPLNHIALIELGIMPPLFALMVVEDAMTVITQVAGCDKSMEVFQRVDDISVPVDLMVGGSGRARENTAPALAEPNKEQRRHDGGEHQGGGQGEVTVRALASDDSGASARGKSKVETLLRILESRRGSQL
ncbi:hypothetical protein B296_00018843 [Ensete ventricosum]|uniref:Uncharacterized protein n=1 Tax=Ensete ventricosum TaxID=4639 RepID=A0A426XRI6_ENSVE|nr:hypothetical protein B296_00018843 [Ensete ventricosum]